MKGQTAGAEPLARSPGRVECEHSSVCVCVLVMSCPLLVCGGGKKEAREGLLGAVRLAHTTTTVPLLPVYQQSTTHAGRRNSTAVLRSVSSIMSLLLRLAQQQAGSPCCAALRTK